jgi:hypothetical protein
MRLACVQSRHHGAQAPIWSAAQIGEVPCTVGAPTGLQLPQLVEKKSAGEAEEQTLPSCTTANAR